MKLALLVSPFSCQLTFPRGRWRSYCALNNHRGHEFVPRNSFHAVGAVIASERAA
jgi:hypothetical protein